MDKFHDENGLRTPKLVLMYNRCIKDRDEYHRLLEEANESDPRKIEYHWRASLYREKCEGMLDAIYMLGYRPIWKNKNDPTGLMASIEKLTNK